MTINRALYGSQETGDHHATPEDFYKELDAEFDFTLDPCSSKANHKAPFFLALDHDLMAWRDGLTVDWHELAWAGCNISGQGSGTVFMNPPYGKTIGLWMAKAKATAEAGTTVVCLVPARTDTRWFHETVVEYGAEVRYVKGRLRFGGQTNSAPFPSLVVIFHGKV